MASNPYAVLADENAPATTRTGETNPYAEIQRDDVLKEAPDPSYVDRFKLNVEAGKRYNTVGGALADAVGPQAKMDRQWFDKNYNSFPEWSGFLEGSTALAGQLVGTAASPENFVPIGLGEKLVALSGKGVSALWSRVFAGSVDAAVTNAATDLAIQGVEIQAGHRENFDPVQYGIGILLGAGIGGAGGAVARGIEKFTAGSAAKIDAPADLARGVEADPMNGRTVTVADNQANAPDGMVRVVLEDGQSTLVGESILTPSGPKTPERVTETQTAAPASAQPSQPSNAAVSRPVPQAEPIGPDMVARPASPSAVPAAEPVGSGRALAATADGSIGERLSVRAAEVRDLVPAEQAQVQSQPSRSSWEEFSQSRPDTLSIFSEGENAASKARDLAEEARIAGKTLEDEIFGKENGARYRILMRQERSSSNAIADKAAAERAKMEDTLTDAQRSLLFEGADETNPDWWRAVSTAISDHTSVEAADLGSNLAHAVKDFPKNTDWEQMGWNERLSAIAVQTVGSDAQKLGVSLDDVLSQAKDAIKARYPDLDDAAFMTQSLMDALGQSSKKQTGTPRSPAVIEADAKSRVDEATIRDDEIGEFMNMAAPHAAARNRPGAGIAKAAVENIARVRETAEALAKALDVSTTRQGRISGGSRVLGTYGTRSGVVRVRSLDDFDTLTHEYGHHLEAKLKDLGSLKKKHAAELEPMAYAGANKKHLLSEGFAEFFRLWVTNRPSAEKAAPQFAAAFDQSLKTNVPDMATAIDAASDAWTTFLNAPSTVAVASTIVSAKEKGWIGKAKHALEKSGVAGTIGEVLQRFYTFTFDALNPINRAVKALSDLHMENTGKPLDIKVSDDPHKLALMSRGAYSAGHMDLVHGVVPYRATNPASPSLRDALIEAMGKPNFLSKWDDGLARDFGSYLWSRRALGEWNRYDQGLIPNQPDKLTKGDHLQNVADLEASNPQFVSAADKVHQFALEMWKKKRDAGLITSEQYDEGLLIRDYVPGRRDFSETADGQISGKPSGGKAKTGFIRRFGGSKKDVINPIESLISDAYETSMAIVRNDVLKTLDRLALNAGTGAGAIAERIPVKELRGSIVDPLEAIESAAKNAGLSRPDIVALRDMVEGTIGDEKANIFRPAMINEKGEAIAFFRDGGELRALRLADGNFGKEMYRALTGMGPVEKNFFIETLAWPARILRMGITAAPEFIFANLIRDQVLSAVYYGKPFKRLGLSLKGAADDLLGRDTARLYSSVYGISGGSETAGLSQTMVKKDLQGLRRKGWATQRLTSFGGIFEATELAETSTRLGLFKTFIDEAKARGLDDYEAAMEASWQARSYIDFDRRGSGMAAAAKLVPFLNASLQGLDKFRMYMLAPVTKKMMGETLNAEESRALGQSAKAWARVAALVTFSTSLYALMSKHDDHDEISVQTRSSHWMIKWGDKWIAVPKPQELAVFANLGEAAYDAISRNDATAFSKWGDSLFYTLVPPSIIEDNPAIKSYFEMKANKDFFTGAPIVPEHLQGMEPFQQYTEKTSTLSRQIGGMFGLAPVEWDHLILAHTGSIGRGLLSLYDMAQPDAPGFAWDDAPISRRFIKDASRGSQSVTRFWEMAAQRGGELEGKAATWRSLFETGDAAGAADYLAKQKDEAKAYISIAMMDAKTIRLHPIVRARGAVQAIGAVRRDLAANRLTDRFGDPIAVSSAARTAADDILSKTAMAIERNALVAIGEPGWSQRTEIDEQGFYRELQAVSPELTQRLADAYATKKVWDWDAVKAAWPDLRSRAITEGSEAITLDLVRTVEAEGNPLEGGIKIKRKEKPALIPAPQ